MPDPIDTEALKVQGKKDRVASIEYKTGRLAELVMKCDPPPKDVPGVLNWLVRKVGDMIIGNVLSQVMAHAQQARAADPRAFVDESDAISGFHEAELMKAIEHFTRLLNAKNSLRGAKKKILTPNKGLVMPVAGGVH